MSESMCGLDAGIGLLATACPVQVVCVQALVHCYSLLVWQHLAPLQPTRDLYKIMIMHVMALLVVGLVPEQNVKQ